MQQTLEPGRTRLQGMYQLIGPPGTGKTYSLVRQVQGCMADGDRVIVCSLTRAAASEVRRRDVPLPRNQMGTLHSYWMRAYGGSKDTIAEHRIKEWNAAVPHLRLGRSVSDRGAGREGEGPNDWLYHFMHLLRHRMTEHRAWPMQVKVFAERWEAWKEENGLHDWTDMVEIPLREGYDVPFKADVILADEAQDHSRLEFELLRHWLEHGGARALVLFGDPRQSLFVWRGAYPELFDLEVPEGHRKLLSRSYRVPAAVHELATDWWDRHCSGKFEQKYEPTAEEGEIYRVTFHYEAAEDVVSLAEELSPETVLIIGACQYMLMPTLAVLRERGIPFANPWNERECYNPLNAGDGRADIKTTISRLQALLRPWYEPDFVGWTNADVALFSEHMTLAALNRGARKAFIAHAEYFPEEYANQGAMHELFNADALEGLGWIATGQVDAATAANWWADRLKANTRRAAQYLVRVVGWGGVEALDPRGARVYVGNTHTIKGGEADHVILFPDVSPAGWDAWENGDRDAVVREFYVAITRARKSVWLAAPATRYHMDL
jgi:hypothetical protein